MTLDSQPWYNETWSKGHLLGVDVDENSGYRAMVWFEYTRHLFNEIREGSLIAIRNFSDRPRNPDGSPAGDRKTNYEEYSILQVDLVHPWHYAIQGSGESGYPGFTIASAISARKDWEDMDEVNRDDVSRIKCEAIPLRLAFKLDDQDKIKIAIEENGQVVQKEVQIPKVFNDRSMPMPGYEAYLLKPEMTQQILNRGLNKEASIHLGNHAVQHEVRIGLQLPELLRLHFGVFGYTGAGKSNLISTLIRKTLERRNGKNDSQGDSTYKTVIFDLTDEYTGLLIDQLDAHKYSTLVVCGRGTLPQKVLTACEKIAIQAENARELALEAAKDWSDRLILPTELKPYKEKYITPLYNLIINKKIVFYETKKEQGNSFSLDIEELTNKIGAKAYGTGVDHKEKIKTLKEDIEPLINEAKLKEAQERDKLLDEIVARLKTEQESITTAAAKKVFDTFIKTVEKEIGSKGTLLQEITTYPSKLAGFINYQPQKSTHSFQPSLTIIIGENENRIAEFARLLIEEAFRQRRERSILYPTVSFIFDEADVFIGTANRSNQQEISANVIEQATLLARRGRKFGLGLGIATQRILYLDTSIMAQPHTYFISKLPRKSDRERVAEAFAISDETFEQTFTFTTGQWLVTSHDATGLKGTPFPVRIENANKRVIDWLNPNNDSDE